jgi:hypothetical protein
MSKIKKKLLGSLFFAMVAVVTGIATALPLPSASAVSDSGSVQITVIAPTYSYSLGLTEPSSPFVTQDPVVPLAISYSNSNNILVYVCNKDVIVDQCTAANSTLARSINPSTPNTGTINTNVTIPDFGRYQIWAQGYDQTSGVLMPQKPFVDVVYEHSLGIVPDSPVPGNPTGKIYFGLNVCSINVMIFDKDDDLVREFKYEPTQEERSQGYLEYDFPLDQPFEVVDEESGQTAELPPLEKGDYRIVVQACDCDDSVLEEVSTTISYQPIEPPNTGAINILGLTVSRVDYIIAGLVGFIAVAVFGVYLVLRKSHRR